MSTFREIEISKIKILPNRQRKDMKDVDMLAASIKSNGLIHPILIDERDGELILVAGERRLTACKLLGWKTIPAQLRDELTSDQAQILELEENVRRSNLTWQEEVEAVARIDAIYKSQDKNWTQEKTAAALCVAPFTVSSRLAIARELKDPNSKVHNASSLSTAANIIERKNQRAAQSELDVITSIMAKNTESKSQQEQTKTELQPIINTSFIEWAKTYSGQRFNFLHCDFPYGIEFDSSEQGGMSAFENYQDSEDVYWELLHSLAENWDTIMAEDSHIMFWFSMKFYSETIKFFKDFIPQVKLGYMPLVWVKSDNKGILPDAKRGPRQIYETALFGYTGDRLIVRAKSNAYSAPTSKAIHVSEKPIPMLKHFFEMIVDDSTRMLDPTCGSGNALRAASALSAAKVLGLEINSEIAAAANLAYAHDEKMKILSKK